MVTVNFTDEESITLGVALVLAAGVDKEKSVEYMSLLVKTREAYAKG